MGGTNEKSKKDVSSGHKRGWSKIKVIRKRRSGAMPRQKHLRGVGTKEQRQYQHIKENAQRSGRYGKRAKEVAARTVLKQHKMKHHKKGQ
jgi:hypothetical protein